MATQRRRRRNVPVSVVVAVSDVTLEAGETATASYSATMKNGLVRTTGVPGTFTSSTAAATVAGATVTAAGAGTPGITYTTAVGAVVDASPVVVTTTFTPNTVNVTLATASIEEDETVQATATVTNLLAVAKLVPGTVIAGTWASSDTDVATVDSTGLVTAVAAGTCTINFTTTTGSKTDSTPPTLTVTAP